MEPRSSSQIHRRKRGRAGTLRRAPSPSPAQAREEKRGVLWLVCRLRTLETRDSGKGFEKRRTKKSHCPPPVRCAYAAPVRNNKRFMKNGKAKERQTPIGTREYWKKGQYNLDNELWSKAHSSSRLSLSVSWVRLECNLRNICWLSRILRKS